MALEIGRTGSAQHTIICYIVDYSTAQWIYRGYSNTYQLHLQVGKLSNDCTLRYAGRF